MKNKLKILVEDTPEFFNKYVELEEDEHFILRGMFEFVGIKINDEYGALLNACNKFIVGKIYKNCLSLGSGHVKEFRTYNEAKDFVSGKPKIK